MNPDPSTANEQANDNDLSVDQSVAPGASYQPTIIQPGGQTVEPQMNNAPANAEGSSFAAEPAPQPVVTPEQPLPPNPQPPMQPLPQSQPFPPQPQQPVMQTTPTPSSKPQQFNSPFMNGPAAPAGPVPGQYTGAMPPLSPTVGQPIQPMSALPPKKSRTKKFVIILVALSVLMILMAVAYVFAIYIPNQPQNVWKTGLNRSGQAINALVNQGTEKQTLEAFKKSEVNATITANVDRDTYSGEVNMKYDAANAAGDLKISTKQDGQADKVFTSKFLSQFKDSMQFPNVYVQFSGLKSFGLDSYMPALTGYENKWIGIEESYLKTLGISPQEMQDAKDNQITSEEVSEAIRTITNTANQYLLTTDSQKAVFEQRSYVGKEKVNGKTAYHYVVGINKQHAKDFCGAVVESLTQTQLYKKYNPEGTSEAKDSLVKSCQESVDQIKDSTTFDMWIDAKYKLIYKIRITDEEDKSTYVDIGQNYSGGDEVSFFITGHNGKANSDTKFAMATNLKTHVSKAAFTATSQGESSYDVKVTLEAKPYSGDINTDKPAGVVPISDVLRALGIDPAAFGSELSGGGSASRPVNPLDAERQTDIRAIHGQVEAYYAQNGRYPTLANLNDAKWLKANMAGLDVTALKDPENTKSAIADKPAPKVYAYQVLAADKTLCDNSKKNCVSYTLTATLSDGTTFIKQNLN